ncbi:ATP-binding protein [Nocardioides marmorisolisilvae]|uniref:Transcriptional regulator n=1 Tax=Nocardioides marmorisolisilvae TaxID=1542737 RepID=A0A3N0E0J6_9ACTN|nr:BTAD domain-containing putative transcriptional regulator [Nocardioides marmorisolisilvae]RNL81362.1 transcriptional regulator [Nocardioides marmorisolisilvae]
MPLALTLLDGVRWYGEPVVGDRPQALLAALALSGRAVGAESLVEAVWGDEVPANPGKALQVLVSRTRTACGPEAVVREGDGYRLGLGPDEVDALQVRHLVTGARDLLDSDPGAAGKLAAEAVAVGGSVAPAEEGPLAELRAAARGWLAEAALLRAKADSRTGAHAIALPALIGAWGSRPGDEGLLVDLLRSEAAVLGPGAALERYESYRSDLSDRVGADPGPELQRAYSELLALDSPVREGVQYDATALLGRDEDVRRLHGLLGASRVVSVLGPGGLGKTRLAHVIGREFAVPTVHFVELVGVTAAEDLVGEVGSALGVRDSVSGRRTLTPEQRADVRARIAQHLDASPSLLILDNCEHIVDAVADLVAYLVATTRDLRVLTTTRAPLAIAAERVYPLGELGTADSVTLFEQRAVAARPDVRLDPDEVASVVARLDGLPLAIELAAAKVRVMGVADIAERLENRFTLLRGGDRSAPERHQTLLAVIEWSWSLLAETERRSMRWLSVFHDGFTLGAAEAVLGPEALDAVQNLSDQSLLSVLEAPGGVRYRMLETVREFGRVQLEESGEDAEAHAAQRQWALSYSDLYTQALFSPLQFDAVDALRNEENNLADVLRRSLAESDPEAVTRILAGLGSYWTILGDHARVFVLADAVADVLGGWKPAEEHRDAARIALSLTVNNAMIASDENAERLRASLREIGPDSSDPRIAALVRIMIAYEPQTGSAFADKLREFAKSEDRHLAISALQWLSYVLENDGDPAGSLVAAEQALERADASEGPWHQAILHTQVAQFGMQLGRREDAVRHARAALPVLERLGARDDTLQLRALLVMFAISEGDLEAASAELTLLESRPEPEIVFGGLLVVTLARAELHLARGEVEAGLAAYAGAVHKVRTLKFPGIPITGLEPWILFGEATALAAHAEYGEADDPEGPDLFRQLLDRLRRVLDPSFPFLDFPVCGLALFGLGAWGLRRGTMPAQDAVRLLVLADRFAYNRSVPTMAWSRMLPVIEENAPGVRAEIEAGYDERRGPDLLEEARAFVATLAG